MVLSGSSGGSAARLLKRVVSRGLRGEEALDGLQRHKQGVWVPDDALLAAVFLQQQSASAAPQSEQPVQQLDEIPKLQQQRLGGFKGLLGLRTDHAIPVHSAAPWHWHSYQSPVTRGEMYHTSGPACQQGGPGSEGEKTNLSSSAPEQPQQQQQQQDGSSGTFVHGIHSSHEPPIHDLHYRISQVKPRGDEAGSPGHSAQDAGGVQTGYHPDGELDATASAALGGSDDDDALSGINTDAAAAGPRLRFRRRSPLFQVIEFHASGTAIEEYRERTPNELGLHPRDVTLFAPISRLAAPQRATLTVHDGKILVKTEVVKAIITPEKAILIKSRRQKDTQKIAQAILAANDQRLMAFKLWQHQHEQLKASATPIGIDSCKRAASAADLITRHTQATHTRTGYRSNRLTYPAQDQRQPGAMRSGRGRGSIGQVLGPGSLGVQDPSSLGVSRQGSGMVIEPAGVTAAGDAVRRTANSGGSITGSDLKDVPFEMLVLEVLLDATTEYFFTKVQHLNWMLESIAADIRQPGQVQGAIDKAHQLIPIQKFLSGLKNDVKETCAAISAALEDNETLEELCLSWHVQQRQHVAWSPVELQQHRAGGHGVYAQYQGANGVAYSPAANGAGVSNNKLVSSDQQVRMLTEMLESYEREIQSLEGSVNEAEEDLENTRSLWHMQLDSSRNHIIMVNLWLSMLNISVMATTILPAFFGMNLHSGLSEDNPAVFFAVCGLSVFLSALSYPLSRYWYNRNWRKINENELFEQKMLRVLLVQNIEDVDDIVKALRRHRGEKIDRRRFRQLVFEAMGNRALTPTHIDFLWQCFDRNRDGFLEEAELIKPLNTYHSSSTDDGSKVDSRGSRFNGYDSAQYPQQQQSRACALAAQGLPRQLGSLEGLRSRQNGFGGDSGQGLGPRDPLGYSGTLRAPAGKAPGSKQRKTDSEDGWQNDERFNWD